MTPESRPSLWHPLAVGPLVLRHRLVMAAMGTGYPARDGTVSDQLVAYLARRAAGGVALVTTEATAVDGSGAPFPGVLRADEDHKVPGLRRLADTVHAHGAPIALQLYHAGRQMSVRVSGRQPVAPSAVPCPLVNEMPRALAPAEIEELVERFADAAERAREAGFDAIELHGAHGYLIHQFLTPLANRREDAWGGDLPGRARFALAVVRRIRNRLGRDFPILFKLSAEDRLPGGLTLDDTCAVGRWLAEAGVDALVVSAGTYGSFDWIVQPLTHPPGCLRAQAARVRHAAGIPIAAVGRIGDAELAAAIVAGGEADMVAMGRALLADPDLPRKAQAGRGAEVRPCVTCNECLTRLVKVEPIRCAVNPALGREAHAAPAAAAARRVVVVGGGPAGMQAALVAHERGHTVTLLEARTELGGRLALSTRPSFRREVARFVDYLARRLHTAGVEVCRGHAATASDVAALAPDAVVVAAGGQVAPLELPVDPRSRIWSVDEILAQPPTAPGRAVVLGDGSGAGYVACWLHECGFDVTVLAPGSTFARDVESQTRKGLIAELARLGVAVRLGAIAQAIEAEGVRWVDADGRVWRVAAEVVVAASALVADDRLARELAALGVEVRAAGACAGATDLVGAVHASTSAAESL